MPNKVSIFDFLKSIDFVNANDTMFGFELISLSECHLAMKKFQQKYLRLSKKTRALTQCLNDLTVDLLDPMNYYVIIHNLKYKILERLNQLIVVPTHMVYETQVALATKLIVYVQSGQDCHQSITSMKDLIEKAKLNSIHVKRTRIQQFAKRYKPPESFVPWSNIADSYPEMHVANQNELNLVKWANRNRHLYPRGRWMMNNETQYLEFGDHEIKSELLKLKHNRDRGSKSHYYWKGNRCYKSSYWRGSHEYKVSDIDEYLYDSKHGLWD